jgi:ribosomal protein S18 acetylase RimI-like enzyme
MGATQQIGAARSAFLAPALPTRTRGVLLAAAKTTPRDLRHAARACRRWHRVPPLTRAALTVRRGAYDDARPAARCMADVFRALERPPAAVRPIVTQLAYLDMVGQLSRRLARRRQPDASQADDVPDTDEAASGAAREPLHVLLVAEDQEQAPGIVIGCIEMGVVNVPRLLTKGLLDEIEQWGQHVDGEDDISGDKHVDASSDEGSSITDEAAAAGSGTVPANGQQHQDDTALASIAKDLVRAPYIGNLAVSTDFRRVGIGSRLVQEAEEIALAWGYDRVCLHVDADQPAAKALYARLGYECAAQEPSWHTDVGRVRRMFLTKRISRKRDPVAPTEVDAWDKAKIASSGRKLNFFEYLRLCFIELKRTK